MRKKKVLEVLSTLILIGVGTVIITVIELIWIDPTKIAFLLRVLATEVFLTIVFSVLFWLEYPEDE